MRKFNPCQVREISKAPTMAPLHWVQGALSPGIKQPEHEADHSSPPHAEVIMNGAIPSLPHMPSLQVLFISGMFKEFHKTSRSLY